MQQTRQVQGGGAGFGVAQIVAIDAVRGSENEAAAELWLLKVVNSLD